MKNRILALLFCMFGLIAFSQEAPDISFKITRSFLDMDGNVIEHYTPSDAKQYVWVNFHVEYTGNPDFLPLTDKNKQFGCIDNFSFEDNTSGDFKVLTSTDPLKKYIEPFSGLNAYTCLDGKVSIAYLYSVYDEEEEGTVINYDFSSPIDFRYKVMISANVNTTQTWSDGKMVIVYCIPSQNEDGHQPGMIECPIEGATSLAVAGGDEPATYSVTYYKNDGSDTMVERSGIEAGNYTLETAEEVGFSVDGSKFVKWNSQADGGGNSLEAGDVIALAEDKAFYAIWEEVPVYFHVTYKGNGGLYNNAEEYTSEDILKGSDYTIEDNKFVRSYFEFTGWQKNGVAFTDTVIRGIDADVTLVAQWNQKKVNIIYDPGEGATVKGQATYSEDVDAGTKNYSVIAEEAVKEGAVFGGWMLDGVVVTTLDVEEEDITLTANWGEKATIIYHAIGDGAFFQFLDMTPQVVTVDAGEIEISGNEWFLNIDPISFEGWASSEIFGDTVAYKPGATVTLNGGDELNLYGVWTLHADVTLCGLLKTDAELDAEEMVTALYGEYYGLDVPKIVLSNSSEGINDEALQSSDDLYVWFRIVNYGYVATGPFKVRVKVDENYFTSGIVRFVSPAGGNLDIEMTDGEINAGLVSDGNSFGLCVVRVDIGKLDTGKHTVTVELDYDNEIDEISGWVTATEQAGGELDNVFDTEVDIAEGQTVATVTYSLNYIELQNVVYDGVFYDEVETQVVAPEKVASPDDIFGLHVILWSDMLSRLSKDYLGETVDFSHNVTNGFIFVQWLDENGTAYHPGDNVDSDLTLKAEWALMPQLWFYPLDNVSPAAADAEYIRVSQDAGDDNLLSTRETVIDLKAVNYNYDMVDAPAYNVSITVTNLDTNEPVMDTTEVVPAATIFKTFNSYSLGQLPMGTYRIVCKTDSDNAVEEPYEEDEHILIAGEESAMMKKVISIEFTVIDEGVNPTAYTLTVENGDGDGEYEEGEEVAIVADEAPVGQRFDHWEKTAGELADATAAETTFTMPAEAATVTAVYAPITYTLTIENGRESGMYAAGSEVTIVADDAPEGQRFDHWEATSGELAEAKAASTIFTMPAEAATVTAVYVPITYTLTIENGRESGMYAAGSEVTIVADDAPEGQRFDHWEATSGELEDETAAETTFTMPAEAATVTAVYSPITYKLEIKDGCIVTDDGDVTSAEYEAETGNIVIKAYEAPEGQAFDYWEATAGEIADPHSVETTFTMPAEATTVTAVYKTIDGFDEWPEDATLYAPRNGSMFNVSDKLAITFTWPAIRWATGYVLAITDKAGKTVEENVTETTVTFAEWEAGSYSWTVTAIAEGYDGMPSMSFTFTVMDDGLPAIKEVTGGNGSLEISFDDSIGDTEIKCQLFFYSFNTKSWARQNSATVKIRNGKATVQMGGDTSNGYLYIRTLEKADTKFVECFVGE